ncbi:MAG: isochorismatase family protein [Actinobacteria bacterium]|nr:isochorismatase family protein [Actinomycetota bacterium]
MARVESPATSEPAPGSEKSWHQISSQVKRGRSHRSCWSSVPWARIVGAPIPWPIPLRVRLLVRAPAARSSLVTTPWSFGDTPSPPRPSGNWTQARPKSNCAPQKSRSSVDSGGHFASSSSTRSRTRTSSVDVVTALTVPGVAGSVPVAPDLADLIDPSHAALVTQECQRGVIGDLAALPQLAEAARSSGAIDNMGLLVRAARDAGVPVVHCLARHRADRRGGNTNARLFSAMAKMPDALRQGTESVALIPEIGAEASDIVLTRYHGLGPMHDTGLDSVLRNLGVSTVVGVGVSLNVGMIDFAFDAVNSGYRFVLPADACAGVPTEYADAVVEHTLALVATVVTAADVIRVWTGLDPL